MPPNLLQTIITFLLGDVSSAKSILLRAMAAILAFFIFFAFTHQESLEEFIKEVPVQAYAEKLKQKQEQQYPALARERVSMLQNTIAPSSVVVIGYNPQFANEYMYIVAHSGIDKDLWNGIAIDKASLMYSANMLGEGFGSVVDKDSIMFERDFVMPSTLLKDFRYVFAYPIFDLDNSYSGAILLGWTYIPEEVNKDHAKFTRRLRLIVLPSARALGRAK